MWGAKRIQANNNDSDDVPFVDLQRALPAVQAAGNEESEYKGHYKNHVKVIEL